MYKFESDETKLKHIFQYKNESSDDFDKGCKQKVTGYDIQYNIFTVGRVLFLVVSSYENTMSDFGR